MVRVSAFVVDGVPNSGTYFRYEFFSETEHILIRCGESRRRAGKRGLELKYPDPLLGLVGAG